MQTTDLNIVRCSTCGNNFEGNFCNNCGQKANASASASAINFKSFSKTIIKSFFEVDKGFIHTFIELLKKPDIVISKYIKGEGSCYTNPAKLLFITSGVYAFIYIWLGLFNFKDLFNTIPHSSTFSTYINLVYEKLQQYLGIFLILMVPLKSLGTYIVFRKRKQSFTYHLILNAYIYSLIIIFLIIFLSVHLLVADNLIIRTFLDAAITLIFYSYVFKKYFRIKYPKAILLYIFSSIIPTIFIFFTSLVHGIIRGYMSSIP